MGDAAQRSQAIGVVVLSHGPLAEALVEACAFVLGGPAPLRALGFREGGDPREFARRLKALLRKEDRGQGVLVLVDLFGGTPGSTALSMVEPGRVEVVTGVNLPMAVAAATLPAGLTLEQAAARVATAGAEAVKTAGPMLARR